MLKLKLKKKLVFFFVNTRLEIIYMAQLHVGWYTKEVLLTCDRISSEEFLLK